MFAPAPGTLIAGKYRVERTLGAGGMGLVLAAKHLELDQTVALKVLLPHMLSDEVLVARFTREGKLAAKIESEHVARVLDVGRAEDGTPFLVMEYLEGQDLMAVAKTRGPLPIAEAVEYVLHACDAAAVAHAVGVVHRDLKPANLFLTYKLDGSPCVKVLDFGISKDIGGTSDGHTTGMMGSPIYMSPEQMASTRDVDARTDIWSLGAILFRLLAGHPPYDADSIVQLAALMMKEPPASLRGLRPDVPEPLEAVVMKCLARRREDRYATIAELASALTPFAPPRVHTLIERIGRIRPREQSNPALQELVDVAMLTAPTVKAAWTPPRPADPEQGGTFLSQTSDIQLPIRSNRGPVLALLALLLAAGGVGGAVMLQRRAASAVARPPEATATPAPPSVASSAPAPPVSAAAATSAPPAITAPPPSARPTKTVRGSKGTRAARAEDAGGGDSWGWQR